jgi:hypothetical protein
VGRGRVWLRSCSSEKYRRSIDRGAQNLPGNWTSSKFNLPLVLRETIPRIGEDETSIVMYNDAVVQGLSQIPYMRDVEHWGVRHKHLL